MRNIAKVIRALAGCIVLSITLSPWLAADSQADDRTLWASVLSAMKPAERLVAGEAQVTIEVTGSHGERLRSGSYRERTTIVGGKLATEKTDQRTSGRTKTAKSAGSDAKEAGNFRSLLGPRSVDPFGNSATLESAPTGQRRTTGPEPAAAFRLKWADPDGNRFEGEIWVGLASRLALDGRFRRIGGPADVKNLEIAVRYQNRNGTAVPESRSIQADVTQNLFFSAHIRMDYRFFDYFEIPKETK